jgi:glucose/arabinose dehydrogenase
VVFGYSDDARYVSPVLESGNDTWAPGGGAFYTGPLADWRGNLFFGALRGEHLHRLVLRGPGFTERVRDEALYRGESRSCG